MNALDRRSIRRSFNDAASRYEQAAHLQAGVREELLARLEFFPLEPRLILDLGAGTGAASLALKRRFPRARVIALDLAHGMARAAHRRSRPWRRLHGVQADAAALPVASHSVDLLFSSLMLQWCQPLAPVFQEWQRVLRPRGLALFSSLGPETLIELRSAWSALDQAAHVSDFVPVAALASELSRAGLAEPVLDLDRRARPVATLEDLMRELKTLGAHNASADRPRGLTTPRRWRALRAEYERLREARGLPVTWEVIYGAVFAGVNAGANGTNHVAGALQGGAPGETRVAVSAIGRRRRE